MLQAGYSHARVGEYEAPGYDRGPRQEPRRVLRTYRKTSPKRIMLKLGLLFFIYALLAVFLCIKSATLGYQIVGLQTDIDRLEASNYRMECQIAERTSLARIERIASQEMGMKKALQPLEVAVIEPKKPVEVADVTANTVSNRAADSSLKRIYANLLVLAENINE
jgi:cell division protein FtsL